MKYGRLLLKATLGTLRQKTIFCAVLTALCLMLAASAVPAHPSGSSERRVLEHEILKHINEIQVELHKAHLKAPEQNKLEWDFAYDESLVHRYFGIAVPIGRKVHDDTTGSDLLNTTSPDSEPCSVPPGDEVTIDFTPTDGDQPKGVGYPVQVEFMDHNSHTYTLTATLHPSPNGYAELDVDAVAVGTLTLTPVSPNANWYVPNSLVINVVKPISMKMHRRVKHKS